MVMRVRSHSPSPEYLAQISQQTLAAFQGYRAVFRFWRNPDRDRQANVQRLLEVLRETDPKDFTEAEFADIGKKLGDVITVLERDFLRLESTDVARCQLYGQAIQEIKEAKTWIAQGYSPNPTKRPSESQRRTNAERHAANVLGDLFT